jgi:dipeptidyl aminopeptidase/acylaminoacyl peptidase
MKRLLLSITFLLFLTIPILQAQDENLQKEVEALREQVDNMRHSFDRLLKGVDDILWHDRVGDLAYIDKVYLTGPPQAEHTEKNKTRQGFGNPLRFQSYIFIPKDIDASKKYPLIVLPHGGVHSNFNTYYAHIIRELMAQQYIVIAAEYRGSTGYGSSFYNKIDYGGLEVEDVFATREYMVENYNIVDSDRVGIIGWSHGGLITLFNIFNHPEAFKVAYAGVPVSDLIARMGYKTQRYRDLYSVDYHIGKTAYEDVEEYKKRSPAWHAEKLETPLLIHTNTNDADVNVLEVEHLIKSLKAEGKKFEYEIYEDIPGGHSFDRIDAKFSQEVRVKIYTFLAGYLKPNRPIKNVKALRKAAYRF